MARKNGENGGRFLEAFPPMGGVRISGWMARNSQHIFVLITLLVW